MATKISDLIVLDVRFPTSRALDGSDAMNPAPDYSATYVVLETNTPEGLTGHGVTFTIGRGNEISVAAVKSHPWLLVRLWRKSSPIWVDSGAT
jgi:L-fuconate dehydratase